MLQSVQQPLRAVKKVQNESGENLNEIGILAEKQTMLYTLLLEIVNQCKQMAEAPLCTDQNMFDTE